MHFPEHALAASCLGRLGGDGGAIVDGIERKVAKDDAQFVGESVYQTLEQGGEPRTAWSLEIPVLDQGQPSVAPSLGPVIGLNFRDLPGPGRCG